MAGGGYALMIHHCYRTVSLNCETEELAPTAEEAALQHVRRFSPDTRITVTATCDGVTLAFRVEPTRDYRAFPVALPPCFEARQ